MINNDNDNDNYDNGDYGDEISEMLSLNAKVVINLGETL